MLHRAAQFAGDSLASGALLLCINIFANSTQVMPTFLFPLNHFPQRHSF